MPISAYTYEHLRPYMGVFAYTSNVVPNIFCIDSQKISADAQKALGADGFWSRQIINSKRPNQFPFNPKTTALIKLRGREVILEIETLRFISMEHEINKRNCGTPKEGSQMD